MSESDIGALQVNMRDDAAILKAWVAFQRHVNSALDTLDDAHNLVRLTYLVRFDRRILVVVNRHEIRQAGATVHRGECGLKHIGARNVAALDQVCVARRNLEVATSLPVQQPAEDSVAVEAREATPVHGTGG